MTSSTLLVALLLAPLAADPAAPGLATFPPEARPAQRAYEAALNAVPDPARLRAWHDRLCAEPHVAGTPGDARTIAFLAESFAEMGLEVERHPIRVWLSRPVSASLEITAPQRETLAIVEPPIEGDPDTAHPELAIGFNAYAASGVAEGPVVYANYGRLEDYRRLDALGIDLEGCIVVARYGGNYRGFKVSYAEERGAAGVVIYSDPADVGRGPGYPEGGWFNEHSIQRGSIVTKPFPGDPLTPFYEADAAGALERIDPDDAELPGIPVQPIGWGAAQRILEQMEGDALPEELAEGWSGGLPITYRLEGGPQLRVRLAIEQERGYVETENVVATLPGTRRPDRCIVIGCHHDAWGFGASDPDAGMICLLETARSFAERARAGEGPERTVIFAAWAAEEHGIIGSTEWVEANAARLSRECIAYVNLDMAAMGPRFRAAASPMLKTAILDATRAVPSADGAEGRSVYDLWAGEDGEPGLGSLGGGSDHVGFTCHLGIAACGLGAGGSSGVAYHSNYDTLRWYRQVVGEDYASARMVAQVTNVLVARLANAAVVPLDPHRFVPDLQEHVAKLDERSTQLGSRIGIAPLENITRFYGRMVDIAWPMVLRKIEAGELDAETGDRISDLLLEIDRGWIDWQGLRDRPWYRSRFVATDPTSGYAAWVLPDIRHAIETRNRDEQTILVQACSDRIASLVHIVRQMQSLVQ